MMPLDYTFERQLELEREEAMEEGRKLGVEQGMLALIRRKMEKGKSLQQIADELEETSDALLPLFDQVKSELTTGRSE